MALTFRELAPERWPDLERLFGPRGACGGCWCMWWRVERGGKTWELMKGAPAKRAIRSLVRRGRALGVLAYDGDEPVGWCSLGPRRDFPRLERVRAYRRDDGDRVWSLPCFFVARAARGRGVAGALVDAAIRIAKRRGVRTLEAYPVTKRLPAAFAYTGPLPIFRRRGFRRIRGTRADKPLVRLALSDRRGRKRAR